MSCDPYRTTLLSSMLVAAVVGPLAVLPAEASAGPLAAAGSGSLAPAALPLSRSPAVQYLAESLVVDGQAHARAPTLVTGEGSANQRHFVPGRLLVTARPGRHAEIPALFVRLGLTVERPLGGDPPIGWVVQVPEGWEAPWQAALLKQAAVQGAGLDGRMQIQQPGAAGGMVPAGPGGVSPGGVTPGVIR